jgi:DNA transformation protein
MIGAGPVTDGRLGEVGVDSLEALREIGVVEAYRRLKFAFGRHVTLNALYGLEAVVQNRPVSSLSPERIRELRSEHEKIVRELSR